MLTNPVFLSSSMVSDRYNSSAGLELFGALFPDGGIKDASTALCLLSTVLTLFLVLKKWAHLNLLLHLSMSLSRLAMFTLGGVGTNEGPRV